MRFDGWRASCTVSGREFSRYSNTFRRVVVIGLALAAVWHTEFFGCPRARMMISIAMFGMARLAEVGYNPLCCRSQRSCRSRAAYPETLNMNNPDLPSPYPAGAQLFFRAVAAIRESPPLR